MVYGCCHITPDLIRNSALKALYLFQPKFPPRAERGTGEAGGRDHPHPRPPHPWFCLPPLVSSPSVGNWLSKDQPRAGSGLGLGSTSGLGTLTPRAAALPPLHRPPFASLPSAMAGRHRLLLENAQQLVLVCGRGEEYLLRDGAAGLTVLRDASVVVGL